MIPLKHAAQPEVQNDLRASRGRDDDARSLSSSRRACPPQERGHARQSSRESGNHRSSQTRVAPLTAKTPQMADLPELRSPVQATQGVEGQAKVLQPQMRLRDHGPKPARQCGESSNRLARKETPKRRQIIPRNREAARHQRRICLPSLRTHLIDSAHSSTSSLLSWSQWRRRNLSALYSLLCAARERE
jgi:hypothetical protein